MFSPQMSEAFVRRVVRYWTALEYFCGFIGVCSASGRKMYPLQCDVANIRIGSCAVHFGSSEGG